MSDLVNAELRQYKDKPVIVHLTTGERVFATLKSYHDEDYTLTLTGSGPPDNPSLEAVNDKNTFPAGQTTIVGDKVVRISHWNR